MLSSLFMVHSGLLLGFGLVLAGSAQIVVKAASALAHKVGVTSFAVGFLLLGPLTSTPEIFVAIQSTIDGIPQLSVGNLLGGSILLLSLVVGGSSVILGRLTLDRDLDIGEITMTSIVVVAPVFVLFDGSLTRFEGLLLVGLYVFHAFFLKNDGTKKPKLKHQQFRKLWHTLIMLSVGFIGMAISSKVMIDSTKVLIEAFSIPSFVFGLVFLSLGTNLPEFSLAFEGAVLKRESVAFGDFLGSAAANTLIIGFMGLIAPFTVIGRERLWFSLVLLFVLCIYFAWVLSSKRDITRKEGIGLILFYALFVTFEVFGV